MVGMFLPELIAVQRACLLGLKSVLQPATIFLDAMAFSKLALFSVETRALAALSALYNRDNGRYRRRNLASTNFTPHLQSLKPAKGIA